jgi:tRNA synthetases class I (I, L, M and V)
MSFVLSRFRQHCHSFLFSYRTAFHSTTSSSSSSSSSTSSTNNQVSSSTTTTTTTESRPNREMECDDPDTTLRRTHYDVYNRKYGFSEKYEPQLFESFIYQWYEHTHCFRPDAKIKNDHSSLIGKRQRRRMRYVLLIPPPNVTGKLHMVHAMFVTIQDILTRYHRMSNKDILIQKESLSRRPFFKKAIYMANTKFIKMCDGLDGTIGALKIMENHQANYKDLPIDMLLNTIDLSGDYELLGVDDDDDNDGEVLFSFFNGHIVTLGFK